MVTHRLSIIRALETQLAQANRRVVSNWRTLIFLRNTFRADSDTDSPDSLRAWDLSQTNQLLRRLAKQGHLLPITEVPGLYRVASPFTMGEPLREEEILLELNPYSAISHLSALSFHELTNVVPDAFYLLEPSSPQRDLTPIGTLPSEWEGLTLAPTRHITELHGRPVIRHRVEPHRYFGVREYSPNGFPIRVTTPERTLLDSLLEPDLCGGWSVTYRAWANHTDRLNLSELLRFTERLDVGVLKQRVGFLLERFGFSHPTLDLWATHSKRGGSSKLLAKSPYSATYSERWKLSLNAPLEGGLDE